MNIELRPHPSQARHPRTDEPLTDSNGDPVPLFPNQRGIYLDGHLVGFVCEPPRRNLAFIVQGLPEAVKTEAADLVAAEFGGDDNRSIRSVPDADKYADGGEE